MDWVKNVDVEPGEAVARPPSTTTETSGIMASRNATVTTIVTSRSVALRLPSTTARDHVGRRWRTRPPTATTPQPDAEARWRRAAPPTTTSAPARIAHGVQRGSSRAGPATVAAPRGRRGLRVCGARCRWSSVGPRELAATVDDVARERVDQQGDHEQHQAGRDQRVHRRARWTRGTAARCCAAIVDGLSELIRLNVTTPRRGQDDRDGHRLAQRAARARASRR